MVLLFSSITDCHICYNDWTFKFAPILPQILEGYNIVALFSFANLLASERAVFLLGFLFSSSIPMCWAFEMGTGYQLLCGIFFVFLLFSQLLNSISCRFLYCFCLTCFYWTCSSFLFETAPMGMAASLASLSRSLINQYRDNPHCLLTEQFPALCHPSSSTLWIDKAYQYIISLEIQQNNK